MTKNKSNNQKERKFSATIKFTVFIEIPLDSITLDDATLEAKNITFSDVAQLKLNSSLIDENQSIIASISDNFAWSN
jgi:hypothetical protein